MSPSGQPLTILVGIDGSPASLGALREAALLAHSVGAHIKAVTCWSHPNPYVVPYALGAFDFEGAAQSILDESMQTVFGTSVPTYVSPQLLHGHPRSALISASRHAGLLIVGRRGTGGFNGLLMGSVSAACSIHAQCPVMIVPA
ncbi:MAG: universal stress protein [Acidobacteria bacterium]|nr:universal stress protein [Acidobacteriota bacterium]